MGKTTNFITYIRLLFVILACAMITVTGYFIYDYYKKESILIPSYKKLMMDKALEYTNKLAKKFDDLETEAY